MYLEAGRFLIENTMNGWEMSRTQNSQPIRHRRRFHVAISQTIVRWSFRVLMTLAYRIRVHGLENYPDQGRMLVCSNHQSFLDPVILGVICPKPINYLGRKTLFRFAPFGWFLSWNDTIPIDRDASGIGGMKETMRRIKRGESVLMFPEGTRSPDGEFKSIMSGFCVMAKRTKATLMPIGFEGAYQSYSRNMILPRLGRIHAVMGEPIHFDEYGELSDEDLTKMLEARIRECFEAAREHWRKSCWGVESRRRPLEHDLK